jgi:ribosomal protein S18 acetylase RimI-like enzyme
MALQRLVSLHDKAEIEAFARKNPAIHLFELGDLDDFFWPYTVWYGWRDEGGELRQLALLYTPPRLPVLLANPDPPREEMREFLAALVPLLPRHFYAHLDPLAASVLAGAYHTEPRGLYLKMSLTDPARLHAIPDGGVEPLSASDQSALEALYAHFPENHYDARMLQTGRYFGIKQGMELISAAGVHVYSPDYGAAALGNVITHPEHQGRGLSTRVCARLCQALRADGIEHIGLNVKADNAPAIAVYTRIGFTKVSEFGAYILTAK